MSKARASRRGTRQLIESFAGLPPILNDETRGRSDYWQTAHLNAQMMEIYRDEITLLALNRYRWINLPETVDPLTLEWLLLTEGSASIAFPRNLEGIFYATSYSSESPLNMYNRPKRWTCTPLNGAQSYDANISQGTVVFNSQTRFPTLIKINAYAQQLADVYITKRVNLWHQRTPMVLKVPQDKELDAINIAKQMGGGEPMIIGTDGIGDADISAITQKPAPYIGKELTDAERAIWARVFDMLGIPNVIFKAERQITTEVEAQNEETSIIRLDGLRERRKAADELNRRFFEPNPYYPQCLDKPISVVKSEDYESTNWNVLHSLDFENGTDTAGVTEE